MSRDAIYLSQQFPPQLKSRSNRSLGFPGISDLQILSTFPVRGFGSASKNPRFSEPHLICRWTDFISKNWLRWEALQCFTSSHILCLSITTDLTSAGYINELAIASLAYKMIQFALYTYNSTDLSNRSIYFIWPARDEPTSSIDLPGPSPRYITHRRPLKEDLQFLPKSRIALESTWKSPKLR